MEKQCLIQLVGYKVGVIRLLPKKGEEGIRELGLGLKDISESISNQLCQATWDEQFKQAIALRELEKLGEIPYYQDKRIREWCFGSFEGMYDAELFQGVLPRLKGTVDTNGMSFAEIATGIQEADTAGWSESWEVLSNRI